MPTAPSLLRSSMRVSVITGLARIAGFTRWIVLGLAIGTTYLGNTYQTANWIPNIVFELVAGGVLSAVFVPTFVRERERGTERGVEVASALANTFLLLSVPVVIAGALLARPIMTAMTSGVADPVVRAQQVEMGSWFLYLFLPQVPLYVLAMVLTGVLHAHRRFGVPAAAPLFSSLVVIATYVTFASLGAGADLDTVSDLQRWVLAGGTTLGVFVLAFSQLPSVVRLGVRWRPVLRWRDPAVRGAIRAGLFGVGFFAMTEIGLLVTLLFANRVAGGVIAFRVAFAFFELPKALIGLPVAIALLPTLSERFARDDRTGFADLVSGGWRATFFATAPMAAGLFVLAPTLSEAILSTAPTAAAPELVGATLRTLAVGIPAFALVEPLARSFYARADTRHPVLFNGVSVAVLAAIIVPATLVFSPPATRALEVIGLGNGLGHWFGVLVGVVMLARRVREWPLRADMLSALWSLGRAGVMGLVVWGLLSLDLDPIPAVAVAGSGGVVAYAAMSVWSKDLRRTLDLVRGQL